LSKLLALTIVVLYAATKVFPSSMAYLALVPGRTIPCVWNILTSQFLETHGALVALDVFAILFLAKIIEPVYGSKEFLKFSLSVMLMAGFAMFGFLFLAYMFGPRLGFILYGKYCGFQSLLGAYLVAVKQIMPDSEVRIFFVVKLRAKYLSGVYVLITTVVAGFSESYYTVGLTLVGAYMAWLYLRFFQTKLDGKLVGDPSDEFRFATFFPELLHSVVDKLVLPFSLCCGKKKNPNAEYMMEGKPLPGSDEQESNRRRERGQRALEERLSASAGDIEVAAGHAKGQEAEAQKS